MLFAAFFKTLACFACIWVCFCMAPDCGPDSDKQDTFDKLLILSGNIFFAILAATMCWFIWNK